MRVLLVEDELDTREMLAELLRSEGYDVVQAPNGKAALETLRQRRIDLVLTDVMMPSMTGEEMLAAMQERDELRAIPVIVMSAGDGSRVAERFGCPFLKKPLDLDALLRTIRERLGARARRHR